MPTGLLIVRATCTLKALRSTSKHWMCAGPDESPSCGLLAAPCPDPWNLVASGQLADVMSLTVQPFWRGPLMSFAIAISNFIRPPWLLCLIVKQNFSYNNPWRNMHPVIFELLSLSITMQSYSVASGEGAVRQTPKVARFCLPESLVDGLPECCRGRA